MSVSNDNPALIDNPPGATELFCKPEINNFNGDSNNRRLVRYNASALYKNGPSQSGLIGVTPLSPDNVPSSEGSEESEIRSHPAPDKTSSTRITDITGKNIRRTLIRITTNHRIALNC